jgi:hypothetical protein
MNIDPKTSMILNIVIAVLGVLAGAGAYFTTIFGQQMGQTVVMTIGLVLAVLGAINGVLHASSTSEPGPLASK